MSGGAFNYMCFIDNWLLPDDREDDLEKMHKALLKYGESGEQAAAATLRLIRAIEKAQELSDVWRAVEWEYSGDTSKESTLKVLEEYNDSLPKPWRPPEQPDDMAWIYLTCGRKSWHHDVPEGWEELGWERFEYTESAVMQKPLKDLTAEDKDSWVKYYSEPCDEFTWPIFNDELNS